MTADEACPTGNQDRHLALTLAGVHVSYCPADEFGIKRFMAWQKIDRSLFALPLGRGQFPLRQRLNLLKVRSGLMLKRSFSLPHISCWACGLWLCDTLRGIAPEESRPRNCACACSCTLGWNSFVARTVHCPG